MALRGPVSFAYYRGSRLNTAPSVEPVTAEELRTQLKADVIDLPDSVADDYIEEARQEIEDQTGLAMINQIWQLTLDAWPRYQKDVWWQGVRQGSMTSLDGGHADVSLPRYPLSTITSITTYDEDGASTVVTVADVFDVDTQQMPGRITLSVGQTWPVATQANNAIEIVYVSGYGAAASNVPAPLKRAVRSLAAYLYSHRGDNCEVGDAYIKSGAGATCVKYKARLI